MWRGALTLTSSLSLAIAFSAPGANAADSATSVPLQAIFVGDKPTRIDVAGFQHAISLTAPSLTETAFSGAYSLDGADKYLASGRLLATYPDDTPSLAIRLWPGVPDVSVRFYREAPTTCDEHGLKVAEREPDNQEDAEKSFFMARALYRLEACSDPMRKRAARAWFDRAYDLVTFANFFDLSAEAATAEKKFDAAHVQTYQDQSRGVALVRVYERQNAALAAHDYSLAAGLNQALQDRFGTDDAALQKAHLTLAKLRADAKFILSFLSAQSPQPVVHVEVQLGPPPHPD